MFRCAACVLVALACLAATADSTRSASSGTLILFSVEWPEDGFAAPAPLDTTYDLCGIAPNGRTYRLVASELGAFATDGALSADGTKLAYDMTGVGTGVKTTTLPATPIKTASSANPLHGEEPAWSPDGTELAFLSPPVVDGGPPNNIWLAHPDGTGLRQLTRGRFDGEPSWSPDGSRIAFDSSRTGRSQLFTIKPDGSALTALSPSRSNDGGPAWSPDGKTLVFESSSGKLTTLELVDADGGHRRQLGKGIHGEWPVFSPDGGQIAYIKDDDVHVVETDGTHDRVVYPRLALDLFGIGWGRVADFSALDQLPPCLLQLSHAGKLVGSAYDDVLYGSNESDVLLGGGGNDLIAGYGGNDRIAGGDGPDGIEAGAGNDVVYGGPGNDWIAGGPGSDKIFGGPGNDVIRARDGVRDRIDCGTGRDHVVADKIDVVADNCEVVKRS
jgi:dipeptidyl aminopeptidase/acylaminoacyl peptidase